MVEHTTGVPLASLNFHDQNGELAAVGALLERGALLTLDALHTTRDTAASIVEQHGADYLLTVKKNCPETYEALATMPWTGRFSEDPEKGHGRIDRRHIEVLKLRRFPGTPRAHRHQGIWASPRCPPHPLLGIAATGRSSLTRPSTRTPVWRAAAWRRPCNNLVLALILQRGRGSALLYPGKAALQTLLSPD